MMINELTCFLTPSDSPPQAEWLALHERYAPHVLAAIHEFKGFYIKVGARARVCACVCGFVNAGACAVACAYTINVNGIHTYIYIFTCT